MLIQEHVFMLQADLEKSQQILYLGKYRGNKALYLLKYVITFCQHYFNTVKIYKIQTAARTNLVAIQLFRCKGRYS